MSSSNLKGGIKNVPAPEGVKHSTYGRFIPREELNSFSAWNPEKIGEDKVDPGIPRQAHRSEPTQKAHSPAEEVAQAPRAARQEGFQDGYRDGIAALESFKQSYCAQMSAQIGALLESLSAQMDDLQQDMARALAVSATHLARQTVRSELKARPELVAQVAAEAIDTLLLSARHITLRVHPDDHVLIMQGAAEALSARGARVVSDPSMTRGGCLVESDIGVIDASIESRWRRALACVGCDSSWNNEDQPETSQAASQNPFAEDPEASI